MNSSILKVNTVLLLVILAGCNKWEKLGLKPVLQQAGENKHELIKVLKHYENEGDSLKLEAAIFLLKHMPYHYTVVQNQNVRFEQAINEITNQSAQRFLSKKDKNEIIDSVLRYSNKVVEPHYLFDSEIVTADYLINNIDFAFKAWRNLPGIDSIAFDEFCEYILPYRVYDEPLNNYRAYFYKHYHWYLNGLDKDTVDVRRRFRKNNINRLWAHIPLDVSFSDRYKPATSIKQMDQLKRGWCLQQDVYFASLSRSLGIPVAIDDMIHYASRGEGHFEFRFIQPKGVFKVKNYVEMIPDSINSELPFIIYLDWEYCFAKMYRNTWSANPEALEYLQTVPPLERPQSFAVCHKDITNEYVKTADITFNIANEANEAYAYLCVFERNGWVPVAYSKIDKSGNVSFKNVALNVLLIPAFYNNQKVEIKGDPFVIEPDSSLRMVKFNQGSTEKVKVMSKYPLFRRFVDYANSLNGGCFEGANKPDFSDAEVLHKVEGSPVGWNRVKLQSNRSYRYLRFIGAKDKRTNLAEMEFYTTIQSNDTVLVKGTRMSNRGVEGYKKVFDDNYDSYEVFDRDGWLGIDLGKDSAKVITEIRFMPRSDTNYIIPGNSYELMYWDGEWISLGSKTAKVNNLIYDKVPKGALLWLRCHSGGKEERPFVMKYGKQFFH